MEKHHGSVSPRKDRDRRQEPARQERPRERAAPAAGIPPWRLGGGLALAGLAELRASVESVQPHATEGKDKGRQPRGRRAGTKPSIRTAWIPVRDRGNKGQE